MEHGTDLTSVAIVAGVAAVCGMVATRFKQPAIIGFILAGVILGLSPIAIHFNREAIKVLAELGIILLMYFIGMELSLRSLKSVWKIALIASVAQVTIGILASWLAGIIFDWPLAYILLFGFCLALSSTAVTVKLLEQEGYLRSQNGRIVIAVLIAQDLMVAPMMMIISGIKSQSGFLSVTINVTVSIAILLLLIFWLTRRKKADLPFREWFVKNQDLAPLVAMAICFGGAAIGGMINISPAFGAFLGGLIVGNSTERHTLSAHAGPIQAVLMMTFFLSVGLLIDLNFIFANLLLIFYLWLFVTIFKTFMNIFVFRIQGCHWGSSIYMSLMIGQMGEFAFVLGATSIGLQIIDSSVYNAIVAVTALSLMTSPFQAFLARLTAHRMLEKDATFKSFYIMYLARLRYIWRDSSKRVRFVNVSKKPFTKYIDFKPIHKLYSKMLNRFKNVKKSEKIEKPKQKRRKKSVKKL